MIVKKNPKKDVNQKQGLFFSIALSLSLVFVIFAFEWKSANTLEKIELQSMAEGFDEDILELPPTIELPPPPPIVVDPIILEVPEKEDIENAIEDIFEKQDLPIDNVTSTEKPSIGEVKRYIKIEEDSDEPVIIAEVQPEFPGGLKAFYKYISKKLKYPKQARRMGIQGTVYLQFVVDKDGSLSEVKVTKGIGAGCDEEASRVLKNSPKWQAGRQRGRAVRVRMSIPIRFILNR